MSQCGIGSIINKSSGKHYIFKSKDLTKTWENYHALLNSNYHHNKNLQKDWNEFGHGAFVFEIKEITEDNNEILNQKLNEHLKNTSKLYNDVNVDKVPFNYKTKILLDELYYIIGETQINPIFLNKLSVHNIDEDYYSQIKEDAEKAIKNGDVKVGEVDKLLDELISVIAKDKEMELETKKENLLKELYKLTGKNKLTKKYIELLEKNNLSDEIGLEIKSELEELINNDNLDVSIKDKFDELIKEKKEIEDKKIEDELISQLHELTGKLDLTTEYVEKLKDKGLTPEAGFIIRQNIKKQIQEGNIKDSLEDELNNALDEECEKIAIENENKLIEYLYNFTGANEELSPQFISKLDIFGLDHNKGYEIKNDIYELIKQRIITQEQEIDLKIDEIIEIEVIKETEIKEKTFKKLYDIVGEDQLSDEFKAMLQSFNLDEKWGVSLVESLKEDINTHRIDETFDFEEHINKSILDQKEKDLTDELDEVFKDKMFESKINKNLLNNKDSNEIKAELMKIIKSGDIDAIIDLENTTLEKEVNNRIFERHNNIKDSVLDLRENLLGDLYVVVNEEYVPKVNNGELSSETIDKIKNNLEDTIKKDEIINKDKFKYKIDELNDLNNNTISKAFKTAINEEKRIEKEKISKLQSELKKELSKLCAKTQTSYMGIRLNELGLSSKYAKITETKVKQIINSDTVNNKEFKSKLEELTYYKENSLKGLIDDILNEYKKVLDDRLDELYAITGKDALNGSFKNLLINKGLNEKAGWKIVNEIKEKIMNEEISDNIKSAVNQRVNQLEVNKNESYVLLDNKIGVDASKFLFSTRLATRNLNSKIHGMTIKNNMEILIQSGEVSSNNFDDILTEEIENEVIRKNERLKQEVNQIIGLDKINQSFLTNIGQYNLTEKDAVTIRSAILDSIENNKLAENGVEKEVNKLIINRGNVKTQELLIKKVHQIIGEDEINDEFSERLTNHDLDNSDGQSIRQKTIQQIKKGNINLDNLEESIQQDLELLDKNNVKNELNNLSGKQLDSIMKKHSIRGLLPLKAAKITKLMDNVSLMDLKTDLAECGVARYKIQYGSGFSNKSSDDDLNFCTNCGSKLDKGAQFCSECGTKVE